MYIKGFPSVTYSTQNTVYQQTPTFAIAPRAQAIGPVPEIAEVAQTQPGGPGPANRDLKPVNLNYSPDT